MQIKYQIHVNTKFKIFETYSGYILPKALACEIGSESTLVLYLMIYNSFLNLPRPASRLKHLCMTISEAHNLPIFLFYCVINTTVSLFFLVNFLSLKGARGIL